MGKGRMKDEGMMDEGRGTRQKEDGMMEDEGERR